MSIENTAQRRMLTIRVEVLGSLPRDLQLLSAEALLGVQYHLVKYVLRLVHVEHRISLEAEKMPCGKQFEYL